MWHRPFRGARSGRTRVGLGVLLALSVSAASLGAGCGNNDDTSATIAGTAYRFKAPDGFQRAEGDAFDEIKANLAEAQPDMELDTFAGNNEQRPSKASMVIIMVSRYNGNTPYPFTTVDERTARQLQSLYEDTPPATPDYEVDTAKAKLTTLDGTRMILLETTGRKAGAPFAHFSLLGPHGNAGYTVTVEGQPDGVAAARKAVVDSWAWR